MSASSSSSSLKHVFWVCQEPRYDHNGVFKQRHAQFVEQLRRLNDAEVSAAARYFNTYGAARAHLKSTFPNGVDCLGFRMHASADCLPLSPLKDGQISINDSGEMLETAQEIFKQIRECFAIDGCRTGFGKKNILKQLVGYCQTGVVGIGSKCSIYSVEFDPGLYVHVRFFCREESQYRTRIYYKTEEERVQNIPEEELFLLWGMLEKEELSPAKTREAFFLCQQLMGERNDPIACARLIERHTSLIRSLVSKPEKMLNQLSQLDLKEIGVKSVWQEMLTDVKALQSYTSCCAVSEQSPEERHLLLERFKGLERIEAFLTDCGRLDRFKTLLMLLEKDHLLAEAIGILCQGNPFPLDQLQRIKQAYRSAQEHELHYQWVMQVAAGGNPQENLAAEDQLSKEDLLSLAVITNHSEHVIKFLAQGADVHDCMGDQTLYDLAIHSQFFYVAYLLAEQQDPEKKEAFQQTFFNVPRDTELFSEQARQISAYLEQKAEIEESLEYIGAMGNVRRKYMALCDLSIQLAETGDVARALEVLLMIPPDAAMVSVIDARDKALDLMISRALSHISTFHVALSAVERIIDLEEKQRSVNQIRSAITQLEEEEFERLCDLFVQYTPVGQEIICMSLSKKGEFERAYELIESIENEDVKRELSALIQREEAFDFFRHM